MKVDAIRFKHIDNIKQNKENLLSMAEKLGDGFKGFIEEITFIDGDKLVRKIYPIEGTPAQKFRKTLEACGITDISFD